MRVISAATRNQATRYALDCTLRKTATRKKLTKNDRVNATGRLANVRRSFSSSIHRRVSSTAGGEAGKEWLSGTIARNAGAPQVDSLVWKIHEQ